MKIKAFFKIGIKKVIAVCKENKKTVLIIAGKLVIYACKIIIEFFLDRHD